MQLTEYMNLYEYQRSRSSIDLRHFHTSFTEKPLGRLKPNLMWILHWMGELKFVQLDQVTWPRRPPCPYMVKTWKILLLWNQKADDLESFYAASGTWVLPSLFKWWLWVDLDVFYGKVKLCPLCFCMRRRLNNGFFTNCCSLWCQSW